jgi:hypothetical protein
MDQRQWRYWFVNGVWSPAWERFGRAAFGAIAMVAALAAMTTSGLPRAVADPAPATDALGFVDSTARCAAPSTAVAFGYTASSRVAICKDSSGEYQYRGVRVSDGAKLILPARATDGGFAAEQDGITYAVTAKALTVSAGRQEIRSEPMVEFHGSTSSAPAAAVTPATTVAPPTATTPLPPPLPAEVGGS